LGYFPFSATFELHFLQLLTIVWLPLVLSSIEASTLRTNAQYLPAVFHYFDGLESVGSHGERLQSPNALQQPLAGPFLWGRA
jgi:hypothetical protein